MSGLHKHRLIIALLVVATIAATTFVLLRPRLEYRRNKSLTLVRLQQAFNDLPVPAQAKSTHQRYYGCTRCQFGGAIVLYTADMLPEEVRSFYRNYIANSQWYYGGQWDGHNNAGEIAQLGMHADWPFDMNTLQSQTFSLLVDVGNNTSATSYSIQIVYMQDTSLFSRECPPTVGGTCQNEWWEINKP
jgi:hypothetical protein